MAKDENELFVIEGLLLINLENLKYEKIYIFTLGRLNLKTFLNSCRKISYL
jgi:hypothetical protein